MTRKRYLAVAGILAILVGAGFGVAMMMPPAPGVTKANFDRVKNGVTVAEAEKILGPYVYKRWSVAYTAADGSGVDLIIEDGCIVDKVWYDSNETILEKFRRWLRL